MGDSSQEDSQGLQAQWQAVPSPPVKDTQDSYADSQGCGSQDLSGLMQKSDLSPVRERTPERGSSTASSSFDRAVPETRPSFARSKVFSEDVLEEVDEEEPQGLPQEGIRSPEKLRLHLEVAASASVQTGSPHADRRKRAQIVNQASPAMKRHRGRGRGGRSEPREDAPGDQQATARPATVAEDSAQNRLAKRRQVILGHKARADYQAYATARPRELRTAEEPMTPNWEEECSKRPWETKVQKWRAGIREWCLRNGAEVEEELDDIMEPE